jgi:hypothetical protein
MHKIRACEVAGGDEINATLMLEFTPPDHV